MKTSLFLTTAMAALLITGAASAAKKTYVVEELNSANVEAAGSPDPNSPFLAKAVITVDDVAKTMCGKVTFNTAGFKGTSARIHKGGADEPNGEEIITFTDDAFEDTLDIAEDDVDADDITALESAAYLALGTTDFPDGAIRGQLALSTTEPEQTCATTGDDDDDDSDAGTGRNDAGASSSSGSSGTSGSTATPSDTTDDGGCNTSGGSSGNAVAILAGLGIVVAAASRKKKKA